MENRAGESSFPRRLDPLRAQKVSEVTITRYRRSVVPFVKWCRDNNWSPWDAADFDDALVEYCYACSISKFSFESLVAAVEFFFPKFRGHMSLARAVLTGWSVGHHTVHHTPLCRGPAAMIATHFSSFGAPRLAAGIMIQQRKGLRPGELLSLQPEDIVLPEEQANSLLVGTAVIGLGVRVGTKLKRPQTVMVRALEDPDIIVALRRLKTTTAAGCCCIPYSLYQYRLWLKRAEAALGLSANWTPHSPRSGYASEARALGKAFTEIREEGRWTSDSSLRIYIDLAESASLSLKVRLAGFCDAQEWALRHWLEYCTTELLLAYGSSRLPKS